MDDATRTIYKRGLIIVVPVTIALLTLALRFCRATHALQEEAEVVNPREAWIAEQARRDEERQLEEARRRADEAAERRRREGPAPAIQAAAGFTATAIASGQRMPASLAVDRTYVAWLSTRTGEVTVMPREGGSPIVIAKEQKLPRSSQALSLDNGYVYWITAGEADGGEGGAIVRARLPDGKPETVLDGLPNLTAITVDLDDVYFARGPAKGRTPAESEPIGDGGDAGPDESAGGIFQLAKGKKAPRRLLTAESPCAIAADITAVYFIDQKPRRVAMYRMKSGATTVLMDEDLGLDEVSCSIAIDSKRVYWTEPREDLIAHDDRFKGEDYQKLGVAPKRPLAVAVDDGHVYAITESSAHGFGALGGVFRLTADTRTRRPGELVKAEELVVDRPGLVAIAAHDGEVFFAGYNDAEADGTVVRLRKGTAAEPPR